MGERIRAGEARSRRNTTCASRAMIDARWPPRPAPFALAHLARVPRDIAARSNRLLLVAPQPGLAEELQRVDMAPAVSPDQDRPCCFLTAGQSRFDRAHIGTGIERLARKEYGATVSFFQHRLRFARPWRGVGISAARERVRSEE